MLREELIEEYSLSSEADVDKILEKARNFHENYLIKSNNNDLEKAISYYFKVIKLDSNIPEVYYKLSSLLWEKGEIDLKSAIKQCQKAVEMAPNSAVARLYLGYFFKASGNYFEAETAFKESIKLGRFKSAKPRIALATTIIEKLRETSFSMQEFSKAIYFFLSGITMSVYDYDIVRMLAKSTKERLTLFGYNSRAAFFKNIRNYDETIRIYKDAAEKTGDFSLFNSKVGDLFIELKNPQAAAKYYRKALKKSPDEILLWVKLAEVLHKYDKNNLEELIECYSNIAKLDPCNSRVFYELGHLLLRTDNKFNAVNAFKNAIDIEPKNAFYHNSLAYALVQLQDYDGAINEYQIAMQINPDNEWTSIVAQALGAIYHQVKDNLDAAIVAYQTATLLDKNNIDAFIALGEAYQDKSDLDNAIECYCEAIKLNPNVARIYCNLGLLLWEKGHIQEAIISYQKAIEIKPKYEIALNNMGVVYLDGLNDYYEAITIFSKAITQNPNYAMAYYNKGRAYQALQDNQEAANYYQMALDINKLTHELDEEEIENRLYSLFTVA